jgi:hypothetical protein
MTDLLDDLRAADPTRHATPDDGAARRMDAAISALLAAPPSRPRRRNRWRVGAPLAAAACAAGLGFAVAADEGPLRTAPASASVVLARLARADAATAEQSGRYAYREAIEYTTHMRPRPDGSGSFAVVLPHETKQWLDARGDGVISERIREDQPKFPTAEDRAQFEAAPSPRPLEGAHRMRVRDVRIAGLSAEAIAALPTDPVALRRAIADGMKRAGVKSDNAVLAGASQLLSSAVTPPDVRTAIFGVLRREPGAHVSEKLADPLGRTGVAISFDSSAWNTTLVFAKSDGRLLATRSVGKQELPGREIQDWSVVVETGRRDTAPAANTRPPTRPSKVLRKDVRRRAGASGR